ncbi:hypothetical protein AB0H94_24135 [Streptomyces purpurascens]|uniref:hypothetical protein n=1 Tax=Streptomyces purpurascens TaxID=1924 RepID=UPI0033C4B3A2
MTRNTRRYAAQSASSTHPQRDTAGWAAVVSTLLAAIALGFTGIVTYWDVQVARDQLSESQEEAARREREQASMVSIWSETTSKGPGYAVIANRSRDPVSAVSLWVRWNPEDGLESITGAERFVLIGTIPPCTRLNIKSAHLSTKGAKGTESLLITKVIFIDSDGAIWTRDSLHLHKFTDVGGDERWLKDETEDLYLRGTPDRSKTFEPKKLDDCGRDS